MKEAYLIIDSSTGSIRSYVITPDLTQLSCSQAPVNNKRDESYPDALFFEPSENENTLMKVCAEAVKEAKEKYPDLHIKAVSAASQREGIVLVDKELNGVIGFPNIDNRGLEWEKTISDKHHVYSIAGRWVSTLFSALKLVGAREKYPYIWNRTAHLLSISDWIGMIFTGELAYEPSQAGETLLFDIEKNTWSDELCELFSVPSSMLPEIRPCGSFLGNIKHDIAAAIGIDDTPPFLVGGADTQLAIENCAPEKGDMVIVAGTTSPIVKLTDTYIVDEKERCWVNRHAGGEKFVIETNVGVSGSNYEQAVRCFYPGASYEEVEKELAEKDGRNCIASTGSMIFHLGKVTPVGGFMVDAPLRGDLTRADFVLAVLMDYVFSFKTNYDHNIDISGGKVTGKLYGTGGGFKSLILPQMMSDITGREIEIRKGAASGTCNGLVQILNKHFNDADFKAETVITIIPKDPSKLLSLYEKWSKYRDTLN